MPKIIFDLFGVLLVSNGINHALIAEIKRHHQKGHQIYIASNTNRTHMDHFISDAQLDTIISDSFCSGDIGHSKPDHRFYKFIEDQLDINDNNEILFFDDSVRNVEAAQLVGWNAHLYRNLESLKAVL